MKTTIAPRPLRRLGLVMEMGKVVAVQRDSPAASQGIEAGDFIDKIASADEAADGEADGGADSFDDPIMLPEQLRRLAKENRDIRLTVRRSGAGSNGRQSTEELLLPLRKVTWLESSLSVNDPLSVPALGIAYRVLNRVAHVEPGSPAARAGLQSSDMITQAEFLLAESDGKKATSLKPIKFDEAGQQNWPAFMQALQELPPDAKVKLTYKRGDEVHVATLEPKAVPGFFVPERGLEFEPIKRIRKARTWNEQLSLGYEETVSSLGMVFRFLRKLGTQIPLTALGGPVTIAKAAGFSAFEGVGKLLVFLTILSANLAVINFLPIPMLDGGHMVFLAYEGFRGRPASERFVVALHTVGFVFILSLMAFVILLDVGVIPRNI